MLTAIEIENFKAFGDTVRIDLSPITLLFGPNSGGKSSVLHAIHYAREIMLRRNCDVRWTESGARLVDLGGLRRLVHGRALDGRMITLRFEFDLSEKPLEYLPAAHLKEVEGAFGYAAEEAVSRVEHAAITLRIPAVDRAIVEEYAVELNGVPFASICTKPGKPQSEITALNWMHPVLYKQSDYDREIATLRKKAAVMRRAAEERGLVELAERVKIFQHELDSDIEIQGPLAEVFEEAIGEPPQPDQVLEIARLQGGIPQWDQSLEFELNGDMQAEHEFTEFINQLIVGPGKALCDCLESFRYLGPLRTIPPRRFDEPEPVGYSRWPSGLAAWEHLAEPENGKLLDQVSDWLWQETKLDTGFRLSVHKTRSLDEGTILRMIADQDFYDLEESADVDLFPGVSGTPQDHQIVLKDIQRGIEVDPYDVGVGLSQLVPAIVCALDKSASLVAMEQPELHLHPKQQAALGDLLIEGALRNGARTIIVETHSEHLILRLLRRVRESTKKTAPPGCLLGADQLRVFYISPAESTSSEIREMHVDVDGNFVEPWPDDFFEQDFKERFA